MNGIVNFLKPTGMTSSDAVTVVRKTLRQKKAGHLGTLDPAASGVLPIAVGNATRLFDIFLTKRKTYRAIFDFSFSTDTLDSYGVVTERTDKRVEIKEIEEKLKEFVGKLSQYPPKYSAKNVNGKRAYDLARTGKDFVVNPSEIEVYSFKLINKISETAFTFDIECSAGTYIRSLARDLGASLGVLGVMTALIRLKSGNFYIENAVTKDELKNLGEEAVIPTEKTVEFLPKTDFTDIDVIKRVVNGVKINVDLFDGYYRLYIENAFFGVGKAENKVLTKVLRLNDD